MASGFDRLKGVLIAGAVGVNTLGAVTARASSRTGVNVTTGNGVNISYGLQGTGTATGKRFYNTHPAPSVVSSLSSLYTNWAWNVGQGRRAESIYGGNLTSATDATFLQGNSASQNIFAVRMGQVLWTVSSTVPSGLTGVAAFDGAMGLKVAGQSFTTPNAQVDLSFDSNNNVTVTSGLSEDLGVAGLDSRVTYHFIAREQPTVRALFTFQNTTAAAITTDVTIVGDHKLFNSSLGLTMHNSRNASGDNTTLEDNDYWYVVSDSDWSPDASNLGSPVVLLMRYGADGQVIPTNVDTYQSGAMLDVFQWNYNLTIPAGETRHIMTFASLAQYVDDTQETGARVAGTALSTASELSAQINTGTLASLDAAGLLVGLEPAVQANIANFATISSDTTDNTDTTTTDTTDTTTDTTDTTDTTTTDTTDTTDTTTRNDTPSTADAAVSTGGGGSINAMGLLMLLLLLGRNAKQ